MIYHRPSGRDRKLKGTRFRLAISGIVQKGKPRVLNWRVGSITLRLVLLVGPDDQCGGGTGCQTNSPFEL